MENKIKWEQENFSSYNIKLTSGQHFHTLERDFETIYDNFCLLSYLTKISRIKILDYYPSLLHEGAGVYTFQYDRLKNMHNKKTVSETAFLFRISKSRFSQEKGENKIIFVIMEEEKCKERYNFRELQFRRNSKKLESIISEECQSYKSISFLKEYFLSISDDKRKQLEEKIRKQVQKKLTSEMNSKYENYIQILTSTLSKNKMKNKFNQTGIIEVDFQSEVLGDFQFINIKIADKDKWLKTKFEFNERVMNTQRLSQIFQLKNGQLEYFYQEPEKVRSKIMQQKHFAIGLQGGGTKGVSYMGAYRALLNYFTTSKDPEDLNITSMIGSSAGACVACGISLKLSLEEGQNVLVKYLSNIATKDKKYYIYNEQKEEEILNSIKTFLKEYGIINDTLLQFIEEGLSSPKITEIILKKLFEINPSIKQLLTQKDSSGNEHLSLSALADASLMKGEELRQMGIQMVMIFLKKYYYKKFGIKLSDTRNLRKQAENFTMKNMYEKTGLEFTCTAVDTDDYILRFFNHKTTPNLPLCDAVRISASFPIGFQAQKWKQEWGRYYIHYQNTRRQLSLMKEEVINGKRIMTGHEMIDGGMLANFPLKYLDNEKMRPMYFSHKNLKKQENPESYTVLHGFGLEERLDENEEEPDEKNQNEKSAFSLFSSLFGGEQNEEKFQSAILKQIFYKGKSYLNPLAQFNAAKILTKLTVNGGYRAINKQVTTFDLSDGKNPLEKLKKWPLVKFILKLLETFVKSRDNLNKECFNHDTHTVKFSLKNHDVGEAETPEFIKKQILIFKQKMQKIFPKTDIDFESQELRESPSMKNMIVENLKYLREQLIDMNQGGKPFIQKKILGIAEAYKLIIEPYCYERSKNKDNYYVRSKLKALHFYLANINIMKRAKLFYFSCLKSDCDMLIGAIDAGILYFEETFAGRECKKGCLVKHLNCQKAEMEKALVSLLKNQIGLFKKFQTDIEFNEVTKNVKNATDIINLQKCTLVNKIQTYEEFFGSIDDIKLNKVKCSYRCFENRNNIKEYFQSKLLNRKDQEGIHLVAESAPLSEYYFHEFITRAKEAIGDYNQCYELDTRNPLKITSMTSSSYNSIIMFLHASDLSIDKICYEVSSVRSLLQFNKNAKEIFEKKQWMKFNINSFKELQKSFEKNRKEIFQINPRTMNKVKSEKDLKQLQKELRKKMRNEYENIGEHMEASLNYFVDSIYELEENQLIEKKIATLQAKLQMHEKFQNQGGDSTSEENEFIFNMLIDKFCDTLKCIMCSTPYMIETIKYVVSKEDRKEIWKGLLIGEALTTCKIKDYVCNILQKDLNLRKDTTLIEFYESSRQKVFLNFSTIQSSSKCVTFLNYKTRPEMPLWAAILASMSLPLFSKPVQDRSEWSYVPEKQYESRLLNRLFLEKKQNQKQFHSADLLTKLPLQFITNEKVKKLNKNQMKEIFFTLNFDIEESNENITVIDKITTEALTPWDLMKMLTFVGKAWGKNYLKKHVLPPTRAIPAIEDRLKVLDLYINSFDNLITNIYKEELTILPIRIGTLDFSKISDDGGNTLSAIAQENVRQAQCVCYQKFENAGKSYEREEKEKYIYFRLQQKRKKNKIDPDKYVIRFLSFHNRCKGLQEKYIVEIKKEGEENFTEIQSEHYQLQFSPNSKGNIFLQVTAPYLRYRCKGGKDENIEASVKSYIHSIQLPLSKIGGKKNGFTYKLGYNKFYNNKKLQPINSGFPNSILIKSIPTQSKKAMSCDFCFGINFSAPHESQRVGHCSKCQKYKVLVLKCKGENCSAKFCVKCRFTGKTNEKHILVCSLGHPIVRDQKQIFESIQSLKTEIQFACCDICGHCPKELYRDNQCNVSICEACRLRMIRLE